MNISTTDYQKLNKLILSRGFQVLSNYFYFLEEKLKLKDLGRSNFLEEVINIYAVARLLNKQIKAAKEATTRAELSPNFVLIDNSGDRYGFVSLALSSFCSEVETIITIQPYKDIYQELINIIKEYSIFNLEVIKSEDYTPNIVNHLKNRYTDLDIIEYNHTNSDSVTPVFGLKTRGILSLDISNLPKEDYDKVQVINSFGIEIFSAENQGFLPF